MKLYYLFIITFKKIIELLYAVIVGGKFFRLRLVFDFLYKPVITCNRGNSIFNIFYFNINAN